jgi:hypothetical protein
VPTPAPPAAPSATSPAPALEELRLQARGTVADLQLAITVALPVYREAALAVIDSFFVIPDVPLDEAADQLMVYLLLPEDRRDPRFALLGQVLQTWPALARRAADAGVPAALLGRARLRPYAAGARGLHHVGRGVTAYRAAAERAGVPASSASAARRSMAT